MLLKHRELAIRGLSCLRGDDLERAKRAFRGMSTEQMQQQFGQSGRTRQEILDEYQRQADDIDAAIDAIRKLP